MCVFVSVLCVCLCLDVRVCMHVCLHVHMYVGMYVCMYMCVCECLYVCMFMHVCMYVCIHACMCACVARERNVIFNDALNTFYLRLYGVRHMIKDHSDSEKGNPLPPHRLLLSINSKGSFICTIPQTG